MSEEPKPEEPARMSLAQRLAVVAIGLFLGPGAGHFALGKQLRGLAIVVIYLTLQISANLAFSRSPSLLGALSLWLPRLFHLATLFDLLRYQRTPLSRKSAAISLGAIVVAAVVARVVDYYVIERHLVSSYVSSSPTMAPTLGDGDYVLLSKQTGAAKLGSIQVVPDMSRPEVGGIALRVVGVAGDQVELRNGVLVRNGDTVPTCVLGQATFAGVSGDLAIELLGEPHLIWLIPSHKIESSWTVGPDELLLLGDNRTLEPAGENGAKGSDRERIAEAVTFVSRGNQFALQEIRRIKLPSGADHLRDRVQPCLNDLARAR